MPDIAVNTATNKKTEKELNLKIDRQELMNPYVLTPHNELNDAIYTCVSGFLERSRPRRMILNIHTQKFSAILQEKVKEIYREHYSDELKKANRQMNYVYFRGAVLLCLALFLLSFQLQFLKSNDNNIVVVVMGNFGAYFLWKIGDIVFQWIEITRKIDMLQTALNAEITFQFHGRPKKKEQ